MPGGIPLTASRTVGSSHPSHWGRSNYTPSPGGGLSGCMKDLLQRSPGALFLAPPLGCLVANRCVPLCVPFAFKVSHSVKLRQDSTSQLLRASLARSLLFVLSLFVSAFFRRSMASIGLPVDVEKKILRQKLALEAVGCLLAPPGTPRPILLH